MYWIIAVLIWWSGTSHVAAPSPDPWKCPEIAEEPVVECSCDMPHTLRCTGDSTALEIIGQTLKSLEPASVSLLDCTVQNMSVLPGQLLEGVALHGLVISSGEIMDVHPTAFQGLATPLQALGLPNNQLAYVPSEALKFLPELDRLDLSSNKLKVLDGDSFKDLFNLSFVDISNNYISKIAPNTFSKCAQLRTLRLRGNKLTINVVSRLESLAILGELDLSGNSFVGLLDPHTFPKMRSLKDLQLSHNAFSSIKIGALEGVNNLTSLSLHHNQIDVIEDHAFIHLNALTNLDISHNRIVAVSGASLAHLPNLVELDLRHNFLRALTADLIVPLRNLESLRLDDNDISIVASDALKAETILKRLTLSENPLNCDCSLTEFANWLSNSTLSIEDKSSAVCTTPPPLENGLLIDIPAKQFKCGDDEQEALMSPSLTPVKSHITLKSFRYDGDHIDLQWNVEEQAIPYMCDAIFVYEEEGLNEVLLESTPLKCNSSSIENPRVLNVSVPNSSDLIQGRKYRYCVVLLESEQRTDDLSLVLGCSDVLPLKLERASQGSKPVVPLPNITGIVAVNGADGLTVRIGVQALTQCELDIAVFRNGGLIGQRRVTCTTPVYTFSELNDDSYKICANVINQKAECVTVMETTVPKYFDLSLMTIIFVLLLLTTTLSFVTIGCVILRNSRGKAATHQCFMPPEGDIEQQRNKYIKLQATTKL